MHEHFRRTSRVAIGLCSVVLSSVAPTSAEESQRPAMAVPFTQDFTITGDGVDTAWKAARWVPLNKRPAGSHEYTARFKALYSSTGIYFLFDGSDTRLTATLQNDFDKLWEEDVYEVFLWTDERFPIYFEYEISPLNRELPIIVPNFDRQFFGWRPWQYEGSRKTKKAVAIRGRQQTTNATITGWSAEVFVPYDLLKPLQNVPPKPGTKWRANVYRVDHDGQQKTAWDWSRVGPSFHEFKKFGTLNFK